MSLWQARRPSPTFSDLGEKLGPTLMAPDREAAERLAIAKYGRPIVVELVRTAPLRLSREVDEV